MLETDSFVLNPVPPFLFTLKMFKYNQPQNVIEIDLQNYTRKVWGHWSIVVIYILFNKRVRQDKVLQIFSSISKANTLINDYQFDSQICFVILMMLFMSPVKQFKKSNNISAIFDIFYIILQSGELNTFLK